MWCCCFEENLWPYELYELTAHYTMRTTHIKIYWWMAESVARTIYWKQWRHRRNNKTRKETNKFSFPSICHHVFACDTQSPGLKLTKRRLPMPIQTKVCIKIYFYLFNWLCFCLKKKNFHSKIRKAKNCVLLSTFRVFCFFGKSIPD